MDSMRTQVIILSTFLIFRQIIKPKKVIMSWLFKTSNLKTLISKIKVLFSKIKMLVSKIKVLVSKIKMLVSKIKMLVSKIKVLVSEIKMLVSKIKVLVSKIKVLIFLNKTQKSSINTVICIIKTNNRNTNINSNI